MLNKLKNRVALRSYWKRFKRYEKYGHEEEHRNIRNTSLKSDLVW